MKTKAAEEVGIKIKHIKLPAEAEVDDVVSVVNQLNSDSAVNGILVQLPLGSHVGASGERTVTEAVSPEKDVDGFVSCCGVISEKLTQGNSRFGAFNIGHLSSRASDPFFVPCTPAGVLRLLDSSKVTLSGAHAVVLGRSDIVGSPVCSLLRSRDATVTQCHSKTENLPEIVRSQKALSKP